MAASSPRLRAARIALIAVAVVGSLAHRFWKERGEHRAANTTLTLRYVGGELVLGALHMKPCTLGTDAAPRQIGREDKTPAVYCGTLRVPERRDQPGGRSIDLKVALVRSKADAAERDLVVYLAGGPGQSATETFDSIAPAFDPLLEHHHVLLVDQRGTGGSHPLRCKRDNEEERGAFDPERLRQDLAECRDQLAKDADLTAYTTMAAVEDLEAVRLAAGAPMFDLVGISYGTRMAQEYLAHHPEGVRSVVIDGVVPNEEALGQHVARDLDSALHKGIDACVAMPECKQRFGDPYATLRRVQARLAGKVESVSFRDALKFDARTHNVGGVGLGSLIRLFSYSGETAALLPLLLDEADHGRMAPLAALLSMADDEVTDSIAQGMSLSVTCSEDIDLIKPDPADADRVLGATFVRAMQVGCEVWPHGKPPADFHTPIHSDKPVLLLSGERDPVTPPIYADAVLRGLPNGRHLVARGQGHNVLPRGCVPKLVRRFVETLDPRGLDASCMDVMSGLPAFIGFNGAAP